MKNNYETTTHKLNLTGGQISTVLYCLEGYVQGNDDHTLTDELVEICYKIEAQLEEENDTLVVENSGKPYTFPLTKRTH